MVDKNNSEDLFKDIDDKSKSEPTSTDLATAAAKPPKKYLLKTVILLLLVAIGAGSWLYLNPKKVAVVIPVKRGQAVRAVYGTVKVEPVLETTVRAQNSGVVSKLNYKKGDVIKQGDVLAEIADDGASQLLQTAQREYENAISRKEIGSPSKPALEAKERKVLQLEKLLQEGNISKTEYENQVAELKTLQDKVKTEILALEDALKEARQKLDGAFVTVKQTQLVSPQNGVILDIYHQLGEVVSLREQIFKIGSEQCQIRAQINEEDVGVIKTGLTAIVRLYSHQGKDFAATVKEVLPQGKNQEYSVILNLNNPPNPFLPEMTGELNIIIGKHENTLIVPTRAVRGSGDLYVLGVVGGTVVRKPIQVGYKSLEMTELLTGVDEGDLLILNDQDLFKPGDKVVTQVSE